MIEFKHQAYVVVGGRDSARDLVCRSCEKFLNLPIANYPDWHEWQSGNYSIDEARDLRAKQMRASVGGSKFFLVVADSLTHEAQNALLKTLEEPTADTFIFIAVPSVQNLLPTLLSRVSVINLEKENGEASDLQKIASDFLTAKPAERMDMIEQIINKDLPGLSQTGHPDRVKARAFVAELAKAFRQKYSPEKWTTEQTFVAAELIKAEKYLGEPASLAKMILEHLALIL